MNPQTADIAALIGVLWKVGGVVAGILITGWRLRTWVVKFKAGILGAIRSALKEHEEAENKRFDGFDEKLGDLQTAMTDVRERIARIEGRLEK